MAILAVNASFPDEVICRVLRVRSTSLSPSVTDNEQPARMPSQRLMLIISAVVKAAIAKVICAELSKLCWPSEPAPCYDRG